MADPEQELVELAAACTHDPVRWAQAAYDWGQGELAD